MRSSRSEGAAAGDGAEDGVGIGFLRTGLGGGTALGDSGDVPKPAPPSASSRIVARGVPTGTRVPGSIRISSRVPSANASTSITPLSVSTSAITSPRLTVSPGCFRQLTSVPASMSAPRVGIVKVCMVITGRRQRSARHSGGRRLRAVWHRESVPRPCRRGRPARQVRQTTAR